MKRALVALFCCLATSLPASAQDAAAALNALRAQAGLGPVRSSPALSAAAESHARDMARYNYFSHEGRDGSNFSQRARKQGFGACHLSESIAMVGGSLNDALGQWMQSSSHRKNLLSADAQVFGLGTAGGNLWVLMLGGDC